MKILAIVPYHLDFCAGQRFRIELWAKELATRGIEVEYLSFTNQNLTDVLYTQGQNLKKASLMLSAFIKQLTQVFKSNKPDLIFIYREAALVGPAIIEKIVRRWKTPIVYDIDEPLFVPYKSPTSGHLNKLKFFSKVDELFKMSDSVFAVNKAIGDYASKFNDDIEIVPMTVDINRYQPNIAKKVNQKPIIAWVGTRTNQPMIELAVPPMRELAKEKDFTFRIIADDEMKFDGLSIDFVPWSYDIEVPKLQEADIGVVPVIETDWSPYKFFFKTIQFMSLGLPVVAAATGSNLEIIEDGVNGFLARDEKDWHDKLKILTEDAKLRKQLGEKARQTVLERFDIERQYDFLERKFKQLCQK
jgi:glycosyltransferase involved in cell wall biosynthesis